MNCFELTATDCAARAGVLTTSHGVIETPIFMPVGTQGAVKAIDHRSLDEIGAQIILGNTYHLYLRPGIETLRHFGGLHSMMNWSKPILTDSGGFQVFSLKELRKIRENGVEFRSHIDGSKHFFSPEQVINIQRHIGSDIMMVFDECTPYPCEYQYALDSMKRSVQWERACLQAHQEQPLLYGHHQLLFAIGQGSVYDDLRAACLDELASHPFDGFAIGGLAVGEAADEMYRVVEHSTARMPADKPRYLMGVGTPQNILRCIELGVDMFDCVMPTRNARNGTLFTTRGRINIKNASYKNSTELIDETLETYASSNFTLGYLRHLFHAGEILGLQLATAQNLGFYLWLVQTARTKILDGTYRQWSSEFLKTYYPES